MLDCIAVGLRKLVSGDLGNALLGPNERRVGAEQKLA